MKAREALVALRTGRYSLVPNVPIPGIEPGEMLCKVRAVALNPVDWKVIDLSASPDAIGGYDFAGEVIEVSSCVSRFKVGDRILAMTFGTNPLRLASGAFSNVAIATEDLACKVPEWMSFQQASSMAVAIATAGLALHRTMGIPISTEMEHGGAQPKNPFFVLVSGGATATGTVAIQLLKACGAVPIATCSPQNSTLVKLAGAVETFDYRSPTCGIEISAYTNNTLSLVLDCVTEAASMKLCYEAIGPTGGHYVALDPFPTNIQYTRRDVRAESIMALTLFGGEVALDGAYGYPADPTARPFARRIFLMAEQLLGDRRLIPHPIEVRLGGLEGVKTGIEDLRRGGVRATKLVYPLS
ncbi:chaperonin 10-like protein [Immersiella caudata]|uniref:Chaperonin 10-like protein n=1 Tax=Immersiella caudata TaxID=314043 RepID=A0AA39WK55_9PEZI|nr:chaperonin 10-like protein [Immersiella caudata]